MATESGTDISVRLGLVDTFPDDHDKRRSLTWYPALNGVPPLPEAGTRRRIRGGQLTSARLQLPF